MSKRIPLHQTYFLPFLASLRFCNLLKSQQKMAMWTLCVIGQKFKKGVIYFVFFPFVLISCLYGDPTNSMFSDRNETTLSIKQVCLQRTSSVSDEKNVTSLLLTALTSFWRFGVCGVYYGCHDDALTFPGVSRWKCLVQVWPRMSAPRPEPARWTCGRAAGRD